MGVLRFDGTNWVDSTSTRALRFTGSGYADIEDINRRSGGNWISAYGLPGRFRFYFKDISSHSITKSANNKVIVRMTPTTEDSVFRLIFMNPIIANKTVVTSFTNVSTHAAMVAVKLNGDLIGNSLKLYSIGTTSSSFSYNYSSNVETTLVLDYTISNIASNIGRSVTFTITNTYAFANDTTYLPYGSTSRAMFDWDNVSLEGNGTI